MKSHLLPNGLVINHTNARETIHLYQDIFVLKIYLQHGIIFPEKAVVIDGGANIGMFSLFVMQHCPTAMIHAFEPAPKTFHILQANLCSRGNVVLNNCGLGSHDTEEVFTYMPALTTGSGYYDEEMICQMKDSMRAAILADPQKSRSYQGALGEELLVHYLNETFKGQPVSSQVRSLSSYIDEKQIRTIDCLKLDVECRELAVLAGIRDEHWPMIKQIVMEVHMRLDNPMTAIMTQLDQRDFIMSSVPEEGRLTTMIYARRRS